MSNVNNEYQRGADDIWAALKTLKENDYDIEEWIEENSPSDTFLEVVKLKAVEEAKGYGLRVSIDDINCTPPTEVYNDPLKKRMSYKPSKLIKTYKTYKTLDSYDEIKVGCEVFDTGVEDYAIVYAIHADSRCDADVTVILSNGHSVWMSKPSKIIPTTYDEKSFEDLYADNKRRRVDHVIKSGDVVKILKVPDDYEGIEVGSYQVITNYFDRFYYILDDHNFECAFRSDMIKLVV